MEKIEEKFMKRAIDLAKMGEGSVSPNPLVGAVIVKDGKIIGEGYHKKYGDLHAERNAFLDMKKRGENALGATLYVTLEPCCHHGKTPPCSEAIIENKIKKVVIGSKDPNKKVNGGGVKALKEASIEVISDFLKEECDELNDVFFHYIRTKMPYVVFKYAMTADGKIATKTGDSKWISSDKSREIVHHLRNKYSAILVGINTVLIDDPMLNVRLVKGRNPIRIICDTNLSMPIDSKIVKTAKEIETIIAFNKENEKIEELKKSGVRLLQVSNEEKVNIKLLLKKLGEMGIDSILLEGGGNLAFSFFEKNLINEVHTFISPKILGGAGKTPVVGMGVEKVLDAHMLNVKEIQRVEEDIYIKYKVQNVYGNS